MPPTTRNRFLRRATAEILQSLRFASKAALALGLPAAEAQHRIDDGMASLDSVAFFGGGEVDRFMSASDGDNQTENYRQVRFNKGIAGFKRGSVWKINRTEAEYLNRCLITSPDQSVPVRIRPNRTLGKSLRTATAIHGSASYGTGCGVPSSLTLPS